MREEIERRLAATPAMLHSINEAGFLVSVSDAWLAKLGYSRDEVLGRPSSDFLTRESRERAIREIMPEFFRTGRTENVSYQMVQKCGAVIDVLISAVLTDDPYGRGRVSLAVVTDVTALRETKRLLSESEARYRSLVEDQSELVSLATPDGTLRYVNRAYASLYGRQPEEMTGRSLLSFVPRDERAAVTEHLREVCASRDKVESENQVVLPNGERRWIGWTNRSLIDADGQIAVVHSVGRDIQARVDAEHRLQESEARYRFLAENSTDLILLVGPDGKRLYVSPACRSLLGYEPEEAVALRLHESIHPDDAPRILPVLAARPADTMLTYRMRCKDGSYVWVETTGRTVEVGNGERHRLIIVRDIDKRVAAEERLKASEARYRLLAEYGTDVVMALDRDLVRTYVSPASLEIFGYAPEELVGLKTGAAVHPEDAKEFLEGLHSLLVGQSETLLSLGRRRHRDGRWIWVETCYRAIRDAESGLVTSIVSAGRDVSARKAVEDQLAEANLRLQAIAGQDGLTGLANRRTFDEALEKECRRAKRDNSQVALIMIDVDRFKTFNDCYGHPAGDQCLRCVAEAISSSVRRPGDVAARYGGEEFAVILPATDEAGALLIATHIREAVIRLAIEHKANELGRITISAGVAVVCPAPLAGETAEKALLLEADRALYLAKNGGRNSVVLASASVTASKLRPSAAA